MHLLIGSGNFCYSSGILSSLLTTICLQKPQEGTEEWKLLDVCINPKEWI
uniref:Uncharacterized protein n=1 Tax=Aegilops tauschii subsp. strangulata TaxID=200361 RepID=A0A453P0L5_AEGTS